MVSLEISAELEIIHDSRDTPTQFSAQQQPQSPDTQLSEIQREKLPFYEFESTSTLRLRGFLVNGVFEVKALINDSCYGNVNASDKRILLEHVSFDYLSKIKDFDHDAYAVWVSRLEEYLRWCETQPHGPIQESSKMMRAVLECEELCEGYEERRDKLKQDIAEHARRSKEVVVGGS